MEETVPTKERLAKALEERNNPRLKRMIKLARKGFYDDFESELDFPCQELVKDLIAYGELEMAYRAMQGEFDSTKEESERWANSLEGMEALDDPLLVEAAREMFIKATGIDPFAKKEGE